MEAQQSLPEPKKVIMFGNNWCPDVRYTRRHLQRLGIPYQEINIDVDKDAAQLVERMNGGRQRTPTLLIGSRWLTEPDNDELEEALELEGFFDD